MLQQPATNPHSGSGSNYFRVNSTDDMQVSGSVTSPVYYDTQEQRII